MNAKIKIASVGDCCIDIYDQFNKIFPGGTAFNVAIHAARAGAAAGIFSAIGKDSYAKLFKKLFKEYDINTNNLAVLSGNTSQIKVNLDRSGSVNFSDWKLGALEKYRLNDSDLTSLRGHNVAKAVLFKPISYFFEQFCNLNLPDAIKAGDFAGISDSEKINTIEKYINNLDIVIKSLEVSNKSSLQFLKKLSFENRDKIILVLLGKNGSLVFFNNKIYEQPAVKTDVKDTNGAGDAYITHFLITYFKTRNIPKAMQDGTKAASEAITYLGAIQIKNHYPTETLI